MLVLAWLGLGWVIGLGLGYDGGERYRKGREGKDVDEDDTLDWIGLDWTGYSGIGWNRRGE